ncbi:HAMP domain-containing sensor histidine kinase [Lacinutrix neustonica]|uniref:histidine kinase n=1 Tax=Lacinutrix neustonica TaxID=2980107 RepID=A0A9E8MTY4_9FLAO|nr:HAMP domain-containing sensor histidine kinase [Lacinutrix neustonica]WAC01453.1 HAMP domain-containing sensor histidine kinase [Lacinutrix neustonica]
MGQTSFFISQIVDISEQTNTNWELNILMKIVRTQNDKLKDFAHIATHDIRTHVGNLGSIMEFLEEELSVLENNENFAMLKVSLENLQETLEHLNEIRKERLEQIEALEALSIFDYVSHAIYNVNALAKRNACQILNHTNSTLEVLAVPAYLDSIILNFLTNAIKYKSPRRDCIIEISTVLHGEFVVLKIQDNGLGMDLKNNKHKLFTVNGTFHEHKDSRGVGLFITKNHIESIGGKIEVNSTVDQGTCFAIYLQKAQT